MRLKNTPDSNECITHGPRKGNDLRDDEGELFWPAMKGRLTDVLGFNHDMRIPPLEGFIPKGGETVGFMLTGSMQRR